MSVLCVDGTNGGAPCVDGTHGGVLCVVGTHGGALCVDGTVGGASSVAGTHGGANMSSVDVLAAVGIAEMSPSLAVIDVFFALIASFSSFLVHPDTSSFSLMESDIIDVAFHAASPVSSFSSHSFELSKAPVLYSEAMVRPDASVWRAAMDQEKQSLLDMGAFEEATLPPGQKAISLKWVYDYKMDSERKGPFSRSGVYSVSGSIRRDLRACG